MLRDPHDRRETSLRPRVLSAFWGEDDTVWVELEEEELAMTVRLAPGDEYRWSPPERPGLSFVIKLQGQRNEPREEVFPNSSMNP